MSGYYDIINLPHHRSKTRSHMSMHDRAAQFAPFAALSGYADAVNEIERMTYARRELDENWLTELDMELARFMEDEDGHPEIEITYFKTDDKKDGGAYVLYSGAVKKVETHSRLLVFEDGTKIRLDDIVNIRKIM